MLEPPTKRTFAFFDCQNLFFAAKSVFGCEYPDFDPLLLARHICSRQHWQLSKVKMYTGIHDAAENPFWHKYWNKKLAIMATRGIDVFTRPLRYRQKIVDTPSGPVNARIGQEKGIDVRIALDIVRGAIQNNYDVALIFSQDQDLSEVASEIREIAKLHQRWIKIASAFPYSPSCSNPRGIYKCDWIQIDRTTYQSCLDPNNYLPPPSIV